MITSVCALKKNGKIGRATAWQHEIRKNTQCDKNEKCPVKKKQRQCAVKEYQRWNAKIMKGNGILSEAHLFKCRKSGSESLNQREVCVQWNKSPFYGFK